MNSLSESMTKHLCPFCTANCDREIIIIKAQDITELYCSDYKPNKEKIKEKAYRDSKVNITAHKGKALMNLNI